MNKKFLNIIEELKNLTLWEAVELIKELELAFGIDINYNKPLSDTNNTISNDRKIENDTIEEQTSFKVTLIEVPADKKISILKVVRNIMGLGLKESKEIVDNVPKIIKEDISKEQSENIKKEIENLGGKVTIS